MRVVAGARGSLSRTPVNTEVYGNFVDSNRKGVLFYNLARGSGQYGVYEVDNDYVHGNIIKMPLVPSDTNPYSGFKFSNDSSLFTLEHVRFADNSYLLTSLDAKQFAWNGQQYTKDVWMSLGQDTLGSYRPL